MPCRAACHLAQHRHRGVVSPVHVIDQQHSRRIDRARPSPRNRATPSSSLRRSSSGCSAGSDRTFMDPRSTVARFLAPGGGGRPCKNVSIASTKGWNGNAPDPSRQRPVEHLRPTARSARRHLGQQPALTDARLACQERWSPGPGLLPRRQNAPKGSPAPAPDLITARRPGSCRGNGVAAAATTPTSWPRIAASSRCASGPGSTPSWAANTVRKRR